ncbi:MAG: serine hydrolase [Deltaproteobacteria bacterium]|nr:serine hydrolase [Deltaproteobacteria bacterium]
MVRKILLFVVAGALPAVLYGVFWLQTAAHVGAGFAAKVACSLVLDSAQSPEGAVADYIAAETAPLGALLRFAVTGRAAEATALGVVRVRAIHRPGLGCTLLPDGDTGLALPRGIEAKRPKLDPASPWPLGDAGPSDAAPPAVEAAIDHAFAEPAAATGNVRRTTAIVVAHDGRLVAERYAPGYGPNVPMLSWSMAKSVLAALVAIEVADGRLALHERAPVPEWASDDDPRRAITLDQLLRMSSGLGWDEHYGAVNDVSRMLFTMPDTGAFAARSPLVATPDTVWYYSSGTSNIVARILRELAGNDLATLVRHANERLFDAAAMTSAMFEPDVSGTFIGSSFAFMTARDWARFGELHREDGVWNGRRILPEGWVRYVTTPTPAAPEGQYGAHWWLNAGEPKDPARRPWPDLPTDTYAARGHSGQYVVVVPSAKLVVVRLGLSEPDNGDDGAARLVAEILAALSR